MRHGLFGKLSPSDTLTEFNDWREAARLVREMSYRRVNIFRGIISFAPDTAVKLHLTDHKAWEDYVEQQIHILAEKNGIRRQNLQWAAAHHDEHSHPHAHIVFWNKNQRTMIPYVNPKIPDCIRRQLIKDTFAEQIQAYIAAKDRAKSGLMQLTDETITEYEEYMKSLHPKEYKQFRETFGSIDDEEKVTAYYTIPKDIDENFLTVYSPRLFTLLENLPKSGRLLYKLLPEDMKAELDNLVSDMKQDNEYIRQLVDDYVENKCKIAALYSSDPDSINDYRQKVIHEADKLIANKILSVLKAMLAKNKELSAYEYSEAQKRYYTNELFREIMILLEQSISALDDEYEAKHDVLSSELSKAAKKEWYLKHKDKGMER